MPFQVTFSTKLVNLMDVRLLSAGDDQTLYCGLIVQLNAIVDKPLSLPGHIISWEQLDGTPVTLSDANTLHPWYPFTETTDKIFRCWIDRGTLYEQHRDVRIYHTPTERCSMSFAANHSFNRFIPIDEVPCSSITPKVNVTPVKPEGVFNDDNDTNIQIEVTWGLPTHPDLQPLITRMVLYENGIPMQTYALADTRFYVGGRSTYSIWTEFNVRGIYINSMSCDKDFTGLVIPNTQVIDDVLSPGSFSTKHDFNVIRYSNDRLSPTPDYAYMSFASEHSYIPIRYVPKSIDPQTSGSFYSFAVNHTINITRYDPSGIGG